MRLEHIVVECPHLLAALAVFDGVLACQFGGGRKAQSLVGHAQHVLLFKGIDGDIGGEPRLELELLVGCADHHFIGHHVVGGGGFLPHLGDTALEHVFGEGIHGERHALSFLHVADVGFIHIGDDTHVSEVLGNGEQGRSRETCRYGLSFFHFLGQHNTVDGRRDGGIA